MLFCVAAAVACTKSSISYEAPDQEISIRPVTRVSLTKAALEAQKVPNDWKLNIYAYYDQNLTAVPQTGLQTGNYSNVYFGQNGAAFAAENTNENADTYWAGDGKTYYWPRTGSILFSGYAPAPFTNGTISYSLPTNSFTLVGPYVQPALDATVDLLYSPYSSAASCESHQVVPMEFKHALAWVEFTASTDKASDDNDVFKITGLKLEKMASKASVATLSSTGAAWQGLEYDDFTFFTDASASGKDVTEASGEIADVPQAGLVIPAELKDDMVLVVNYKMKKEASSTSSYIDQTVRIQLNGLGSPSITKWEAGKHYIYDITFGALQPIKVNPTVKEWEETTHSSITVSGESGSASGTGE